MQWKKRWNKGGHIHGAPGGGYSIGSRLALYWLCLVLAALAASENVETPTVIGFTPRPEDVDACVREPWDGGDDYRLYGRGRVLEEIAANRLCFPALSHA